MERTMEYTTENAMGHATADGTDDVGEATPMRRAIIRGHDEGTASWCLNSLVTTKADADETAGAYSLTEHLVSPAGCPPPHVHVHEDEAFYVLEGQMEFEVDGVVTPAGPGTFAFVPGGAVHTFRVRSSTARMLVMTSGRTPAPAGGLHHFFMTLGVPAAARVLPEPAAPDVAALVALGSEHGIEFVAP